MEATVLHARYNIRELKDPKGLLGTADKAVMLLRKDRSSLFTDQRVSKLDSLQFGNNVIAELDYKVSREGRPIDACTDEWLQSQKDANPLASPSP